MSRALLSVSIVTYHTDPTQFAQVLRHLAAALRHFERHTAASVQVTLVDNGAEAALLRGLIASQPGTAGIEICSTGGNLGYGRAHNIAITGSKAAYHLILNPDVLIAEDALTAAFTYMSAHPEAAALSPHAVDGAGDPAYLCKRFPALFDLLLRGLAPGFIKRRFRERLEAYENRAIVARDAASEVDLVSGCFMFCRTNALQRCGGFNPAFFLYFEDFALSLELRKEGKLVYVPSCRVVHFGGGAARKGLTHIGHFTASALRFYNRYGWKLI